MEQGSRPVPILYWERHSALLVGDVTECLGDNNPNIQYLIDSLLGV